MKVDFCQINYYFYLRSKMKRDSQTQTEIAPREYVSAKQLST